MNLEKPIEFLQIEEEFSQLLDLFKERKPKNILEIGVKYGGTLRQWIDNAPKDAIIVAVDDCKQANDIDLFKQWATDVDLHFIKGDSHSSKTIEIVNNLGPFDFVFIDGDHTYSGVKRDFEDYGQNASIVAIHDIVRHKKEEDNGAYLFWQELKNKYETKEFVKDWNQGTCGIGIIFNT